MPRYPNSISTCFWEKLSDWQWVMLKVSGKPFRGGRGHFDFPIVGDGRHRAQHQLAAAVQLIQLQRRVGSRHRALADSTGHTV